ncbi:MAG: response regulator [Leptolyngbya sp.]|nr:response regulator [Leptolyngbya sp.]
MSQILIIEDQAEVRANIRDILTLEGFDTLTAANGEVGFELACQHHPDLILCDVMMPVVSGYQVVKHLREQDSTVDIPFIFLTAKATRDDQRRAMEMGADDYITKPFTPQELVQAVRSRLQRQAKQSHIYHQQIEQLSQAITDNIPQEIQTPLRNIIDMAGILKQHYGSIDPREIGRMLGEIEDCGHHLDQIIDQFLTHARLEVALNNADIVERWREQEYHCDIQPIVKKVVRHQAQAAHRTQDVDLKKLEACTIALPATHFKKVMKEIVNNAFKFSPPGTPIQVVSQASGESVYVYVLNHGQGMTPSQIAALGPYIQFDRDQHQTSGVGLGLAIAQQIVAFHGGTLEVKSVAGQQTIVRLLLPRYSPAEAPADGGSGDPSPLSSTYP